jgi:hypothetical protein
MGWPEIVTAAGTGVLAATALAALIIGYSQVLEASRSRTATLMADLSRRWDNELVEPRRLMGVYGRELEAWVRYFYEEDDESFYILERIPNFFEDLAVLRQAGAIPIEMIEQSLGWTVWAMWERWAASIQFLRGTAEQPDPDPVYRMFEGLAHEMRARLLEV